MDLREIQALHAQYTEQPVIIDIASHTAAMPALPAPERGRRSRARAIAISGLRKAGKPALVALAIAAVAADGGMIVARVWHVMHETVATPKIAATASEGRRTSVPASEPDGEMPIDAAPARPLMSSDLEARKSVAQSALANVDARSLAAVTSVPPVDRAAQTTRPAAESLVAASPIRAQRPSTAAPPTSAGPASPSPLQTSRPPATGEHQARPQTVPTPAASPSPAQANIAATASAPEVPKPESHTALRPLHHITHYAASTGNSETSPEPAGPAQPKAQPAKSGDVQLF